MEATLNIKVNDQASGAVKNLTGHLNGALKPLKTLGGSLKNIGRAMTGGLSKPAGDTGKAMKSLTGDSKKLGKELKDLTLKAAGAGLALTSRLGRGALSAASNGLKRLKQDAAQIGRQLKEVCGSLANLATRTVGTIAAILGGAGYGFKRLFIDIAAQSEEAGFLLSNAFDSKDLGGKALKDIRAFSKTTGRDLMDATQAFIALREGGITPTIENLDRLADMAAKKNKTLAETGEIFKRALKGEAGALEEWGIKSEARGKMMLYQYKNQAGELVKRAAKANDPKALAELLAAVSNDKAAGAESERGQTWNGQLDKIIMKWGEFRAMIMDSGPFQFLKEELAAIVAWVEKLETEGGLQTLAKEWGQKLTGALKMIKAALIAVCKQLSQWAALVKQVVKSIGGWRVALTGLALFVGGPLVTALGKAVLAVGALAKAILLSPIGVLLAIGGAIAAVMHKAGVLRPFIDGLKQGFSGLREAVGPSLQGFLEALNNLFGNITGNLTAMNGQANPAVWQDLGKSIGEFTNGTLKKLVDLLTEAVNKLNELGNGLGVAVGWLGGGDALEQENIVRERDTLMKLREMDKKSGTLDASREAAYQSQFNQLNQRQEEAKNPITTKFKNAFSLDRSNEALAGTFGHPQIPDHLKQARENIKQAPPQKVHMEVEIKGSLPPGFTASAATDAPGAKVTDKTRQSMGAR